MTEECGAGDAEVLNIERGAEDACELGGVGPAWAGAGAVGDAIAHAGYAEGGGVGYERKEEEEQEKVGFHGQRFL
jgi:hypothetical protein